MSFPNTFHHEFYPFRNQAEISAALIQMKRFALQRCHTFRDGKGGAVKGIDQGDPIVAAGSVAV